MKNSVKKAAVTALVCVTAAGMMAGCGNKKLDGTKTAVTVNKQEIPLGVVSLAARMQQAQAEAMYRMYLGGGSDMSIWSTKMGDDSDETYGENAVTTSVETVEKMCLEKEHASEYNVEISEDEQKALEEAAKNFIAANSDETIAELAVDEDMVKTFLELETYDVKMKDAIEAKADVKLDEKEYQQMSFSYASAKVSGDDLSDDDIKSLKSDSTFDIFKYMNNDNTPTFLKKFIDKFYLGDIESAYTFPSIIDYHLTSKIDIKKLNDEIKKYTPKKYKNYEYLTSGTSEYLYLKDEEFDKIINNDLIDDIKNGNVHYAYYDELFIKYCSLSEDKLIDKPYNELKKIFIAGLNKIQQEKKQNPVTDDDYLYPLRDKYDSNFKKNTAFLLYEIEKTHNILEENFYSKKSIELREKLKNDTSSFIDYLSPMKNSHYEDINYPLFNNFDEKDLFDILSNMTNKDIWEFTNVIIGRYKYGGISSYYNYDCKFLKKFSQYVQKEFSQKEKLKLSEGLILNFVKQIDFLPIQNKENITDNK